MGESMGGSGRNGSARAATMRKTEDTLGLPLSCRATDHSEPPCRPQASLCERAGTGASPYSRRGERLSERLPRQDEDVRNALRVVVEAGT